MKEVIMCASILTAIILCVVGIAKLPFKNFKANHPSLYKAVFCGASLVLAVVAPIIAQTCILDGKLYSTEFLVLITSTITGVFGLYHSYDNLGLKKLAKLLVEKVAELFNNYSNNKYTKIAEKVNEVNQKLQEENADDTKDEVHVEEKKE